MMQGAPPRLGKYEVRALLGQGAMGQVYLCHDPVIDRQVAVKILHPHILTDRNAEEIRARFRREARAAARCQHPNIVTVHDVGEHDGRDFIVMEYVQGEELRFFLDRGEQLGDAERLYIVKEVLEALEFAHARGVVHRDIKPANIILMDDGGVKVADFGVAHIDRSDLTQAGSIMGTPTYMAPEGLRGEPVGPAGDLYSVGMVLFELVTGRRPAPEDLHRGRVPAFVEETLAAMPDLPESLAAIIRRALATSPEQRFDTARAFRESLESVEVEAEHSAREALSETVLGRAPLPVREASRDPGSDRWPEEWLQEISGILAEHVGPLAGMLVERSAAMAGDMVSLGESLARNIPDDSERSRFMRRFQVMASTLPPGSRSHSGGEESVQPGPAEARASDTAGPVPESIAIDSERIEALRSLFARHVGPLAGELLRHHQAGAGEVETFVDRLAGYIPDMEERAGFREAALRLLRAD